MRTTTKLIIAAALSASILFMPGCSAFTKLQFTLSDGAIGFVTANYKINLMRFDQEDPSSLRFQLNVEPINSAQAMNLPPIGVTVKSTVAGGKRIDVRYSETARFVGDFQVGLNGFSYSNDHYRVDCKYKEETSGVKCLSTTIDPMTEDAKKLPPIDIEYVKTDTGGISITVSWSYAKAVAKAKPRQYIKRKK